MSLDLLFELWDNLDTCYHQRYNILLYFTNCEKVMNIYKILDQETEILSQFYRISRNIYNLIKSREKKKSVLQAKINRGKII